MITIRFSLPEHMRAFLEAQAAEEGCASTDDDLKAPILDAQNRKAKRGLLAKLDEALEGGPAAPMTREDWDSIEREAIEGRRGESIRP